MLLKSNSLIFPQFSKHDSGIFVIWSLNLLFNSSFPQFSKAFLPNFVTFSSLNVFRFLSFVNAYSPISTSFSNSPIVSNFVHSRNAFFLIVVAFLRFIFVNSAHFSNDEIPNFSTDSRFISFNAPQL